MANLFEKPIAANPMSTFSALPLEFIDQAMQRKQLTHDKAKQEVDSQADSLLKLQYLSGDAERHHELQAQYEEKLNTIIESAGNDYSKILPQIERFSRDLKYEINYGELGAQQNAFNAAMAMKKIEDDKLSDGKSSEEGYNMFLKSISSHKTQQLEDGNFSDFRGYSASTIADPIKFLRSSANEVVPKYDENGMQYRSRDLIKDNLRNTTSADTNLVKALNERIQGKVDKDGNPIKLEDYMESVFEGVVADKEFYEVKEKTEAEKQKRDNGGSDFPGAVIHRVGQPKTVHGELKYSGGSSPLLKDLTALVGVDSWAEHNAVINKESTKRRIKYIENKTNTKFPSTPKEQRDWIIKNMGQDKVGEISTRGATDVEAKAISDKGQLTPGAANSAVYDMSGEPLDGEQIKKIQGSSKDTSGNNKTSFISNVVTNGGMHPPGTLVMTSHNGETYFIEPSDPVVINSPRYNDALINMASKTNTGVKTVTLRSFVDVIPMGTYEVEHAPTKTSQDTYNLYQNGKLVYRKYTVNGDTYGEKVNKEND